MPSKAQITGALTVLAVFIAYQQLAPTLGLPRII